MNFNFLRANQFAQMPRKIPPDFFYAARQIRSRKNSTPSSICDTARQTFETVCEEKRKKKEGEMENEDI
jgi:hypothetical protein